jgi:hypothetical protein
MMVKPPTTPTAGMPALKMTIRNNILAAQDMF